MTAGPPGLQSTRPPADDLCMVEQRSGAVRRAPARRRLLSGPLRPVRLLAAGLATAVAFFGVARLLDVRGVARLVDHGGQVFFLGGVVTLLVVRAVRSERDRAAWFCFAAGVGAYVAGSVVYALAYADAAVVPRPSWADAGFISFYPLVYAALLLMLRARIRRLTAGLFLDAVVTGLTVAAFAAALALGTALRLTGGSVAVVVAGAVYPIADLLLLVLVGGALVVIGRGAGGCWWWLAAGMTLFAATDLAFAYAVVHGGYVAGSLDPLYGLAFVCCGVAACLSPTRRAVVRSESLASLVVPVACAVAATGLLFHGYRGGGQLVAGVLAVCAVLAALVRTGLSVRTAQVLADSRRQARTDELTDLPNRRGVYEALAAADARMAAGGGLAVLVIDLDRFKEVNDSLGHAAGDALLRQVGPRLSGLLRDGDLLGRLGGDEFVVLAGAVDADGALALATRLREELQRPFRFSGVDLGVDASIGVAVAPDHAASAAELLQLADLAMYAAKAARSGAALYDEHRDGSGRHRLEDVAALRRAITHGELVLHYQPKLSLATGDIDGVEALVRWQHPDRGLLPPVAFIDLAESAGLMGQLTAAVVELALEQCRLWEERGVALEVAVNVSPSNLVDDRFPDEIAVLLEAKGLPAHRLVLEVTESLLMEERERSERVLSRLRQEGVGVAIDDYGTGYSSLAYLAELPVTELKLDRTFLAGMTESWRAESIVISTLHLAHALGLALVAEGVEDQRTLDALTALGCDVVQGFHVSRPLPAEELWDWLAERRAASLELR